MLGWIVKFFDFKLNTFCKISPVKSAAFNYCLAC